MKHRSRIVALLGSLGLVACASHPALPLAKDVDLQRFMGRWYVIAHIPTWVDGDSYNAVEAYELKPDGTIATTFTFNADTPQGPLKIYRPRGFVVEGHGNALWGMQFIWPIKAQYKISYLAADYSSTIIARDKLDYVWIMARKPQLEEAEYQRLKDLVQGYGYDVTKLRRVPQSRAQTKPE